MITTFLAGAIVGALTHKVLTSLGHCLHEPPLGPRWTPEGNYCHSSECRIRPCTCGAEASEALLSMLETP